MRFSGFWVQDLGCKSLACTVQGLGSRVQGRWLRARGLCYGVRVQGLGFRVQGLRLRFRIWDVSSRVQVSRDQGSGFRVQGFGFGGAQQHCGRCSGRSSCTPRIGRRRLSSIVRAKGLGDSGMFFILFFRSHYTIVQQCTPAHFILFYFTKKNQSSIVGAKGLGFWDRELGVGGLGLRV